MARGWKIVIALAAGPVIPVGVNVVATGAETKPAEAPAKTAALVLDFAVQDHVQKREAVRGRP